MGQKQATATTTTQVVVVHDPAPRSGKRQAPEGTTFDFARSQGTIRELESLGYVLLPIDDSLLGLGALGGWFKRAWGAGVPLSGMKGTRCCPLALQIEPEREFVHLAVRLVPYRGDKRGDLSPRASVKLVVDPSGASTGVAGGLSALELPGQQAFGDDLGRPDAAGGWTLRRAYRLTCSMRGNLMLNLWGVAQDVAVEWAAVSQARVAGV